MSYLYVCNQGATVGYENHRIIVSLKNNVFKSIPIEPLESIELYGGVQISAKALQECMKSYKVSG